MRLAEPTGPSCGPGTRRFPTVRRRSPPAVGTGVAELVARAARRAWRRADALSGLPDSIRLSSTTRSSVSSTATSERVRPARSDLRTSTWWSAWAATWARWVTTSTWAWCPRSARAGPTAVAAAPPTPASTSSKTMTPGLSVMASRMASMVRASSPPDATLASGWSGSPGLAPSRKRTWSAGPSPSTAIENRAEGMASCRKGGLDLLGQPGRGLPAGRGHLGLGRRPARPGPRRSPSSRATARCSSDVDGGQPPAGHRPAKARTSARSAPYLRSSSWSSCRRERISSSRSGSSSQVSTTERSSVPRSDSVGHGRPQPRLEGGQRGPTGQDPAASASRSSGARCPRCPTARPGPRPPPAGTTAAAASRSSSTSSRPSSSASSMAAASISSIW